jgi:hypothetical protein
MFYAALAAARAGLHVFAQSRRNTLRTTQALETLKPGDTFVVAHAEDKRLVDRAIRRMNAQNKAASLARSQPLEIHLITLQDMRDIDHHGRLEERQTRGRFVLDHSAVEAVVDSALNRAQADLERWTKVPDPGASAPPGFVPSGGYQRGFDQW